ncbi:MAG: hypothetical protein E7255_14190 [Lachnospiraceae bacterium]|nr:hypothetical protein [Lachnospiraceae bacterium]
MKKRTLIGLAVLVLVLVGLSQSFLFGHEVKASSVKIDKGEPQFVMVEITEEEYLARLNEVDNQVNSNKNMNTNETIALPTPMPSRKEIIKSSEESKKDPQFDMVEITEEYLARLK